MKRALAVVLLVSGCAAPSQQGAASLPGTCDAPRGICGDACVDMSEDSENCGACGVACNRGERCLAAACVCPLERSVCGGACVDVSADAEHCGACDRSCAGAETCVAGVCACSGVDRSVCDGLCVDLQNDATHCGACGRSCAGGQGCGAGICLSWPEAPLFREPLSDGVILNPADVHMETAPFHHADPARIHLCTDFEIWSMTTGQRVWAAPCITGLYKTHVHLGDGIFEGPLAGRHELDFQQAYRVRARFRADSPHPAFEWSGWSERSFDTVAPIAPQPGASWRAAPGFIVEQVASDLQMPVNIAFVPHPGSAPNSPIYYVAELYGAIRVVTRNGLVRPYATDLLNFDPTGAFPGSGEHGLAGLAIEPSTGDLFASLVYSSDPSVVTAPHYSKVIRLHSNDGGLSAAGQTTILDLSAQPTGASHQISNVTIGPDAKLYVHNGDGFAPSDAQLLSSLRGKILRLNLDGSAPADNPFFNAGQPGAPANYIYASGLRNPFGGGWRAIDGAHYTVENGPKIDRLSKLVAGRNYLYDGTDASMTQYAAYNWPPTSHAPVNIAFIQSSTFGGSGFPASKLDHAFIAESGATWSSGPQVGKRIAELIIDATGTAVGAPSTLVEYNGTGKASVVAIAAGPDGLYFSDFYKDQGYSSPIDRGSNILRVRYVGVADFTVDSTSAAAAPATISFSDASSLSSPVTAWAWEFGDGQSSSLQNPSHVYAQDGIYDVRLTVTAGGSSTLVEKKAWIGIGKVGLRGDYFGDVALGDRRMSRVDPGVSFDWGLNAPAPALPADLFSVRWSGNVYPVTTGLHSFFTVADDGVRLWIDDQLIIDRWTNHSAVEDEGTIALDSGRAYAIKLEYFDGGLDAVAALSWSAPGVPKTAVPATRLSP